MNFEVYTIKNVAACPECLEEISEMCFYAYKTYLINTIFGPDDLFSEVYIKLDDNKEIEFTNKDHMLNWVKMVIRNTAVDLRRAVTRFHISDNLFKFEEDDNTIIHYEFHQSFEIIQAFVDSRHIKLTTTEKRIWDQLYVGIPIDIICFNMQITRNNFNSHKCNISKKIQEQAENIACVLDYLSERRK